MLKGLILSFVITGILIIAVPLEFRRSSCNPEEPQVWAIDGQIQTYKNKYQPQESHYVIKKEKASTNEHKQNAADSYKALLCGEIRITDLALIWFTCGLVIVGYFAMRSADETSKRNERAYVFATVHPEVWGMDGPDTPYGTIKTKVQFWNHGKTAAIIEMIAADIAIQQIPPLPRTKFANNTSLPPSLGIAVNDSYSISTSRNIDRSEFNAVEGMNATLYCFGIIKYRNVFSEACETEFCWQMYLQDGVWEFGVTREGSINRHT